MLSVFWLSLTITSSVLWYWAGRVRGRGDAAADDQTIEALFDVTFEATRLKRQIERMRRVHEPSRN